jgi:hypothetical protein
VPHVLSEGTLQYQYPEGISRLTVCSGFIEKLIIWFLLAESDQTVTVHPLSFSFAQLKDMLVAAAAVAITQSAHPSNIPLMFIHPEEQCV